MGKYVIGIINNVKSHKASQKITKYKANHWVNIKFYITVNKSLNQNKKNTKHHKTYLNI